MLGKTTEEDALWAYHYLGLKPKLEQERLTFRGTVPFRVHHDGTNLHLGDSIPCVVMPAAFIEDVWAISFFHDYAEPFHPPTVYDRSGRILKNAKKYHKNLLGMHLNQGGGMPPHSFCVARISDLENMYEGGFGLEHYVKNFLIPFLFQQSYFEQKGQWPWLNYAHGDRGKFGFFDYQ